MTFVPSVLFVCVRTAGRSQMAAALLDHEAGDRVKVTSARSEPAAELNPAVVAAMAEIGIDLSREFRKPLTGDQVQAADVVITMGCGDTCPVYPGKRYLDWTCPTRPVWTSPRCGLSAMRSTSASASCSPNWPRLQTEHSALATRRPGHAGRRWVMTRTPQL